MTYTLDDFLTFGPVFGKELHTFASFFASAVVGGQNPTETIRQFATNLKAYYGISRTHTYEQLGLLPLGFQGIRDAFTPRLFSSPEIEHDVIRQESQEQKALMESSGFRYEKNILLAKCFLEREALLQHYTHVKIAPAFLPMGSPMYVPEYVSLWVTA